MHTSSVLEICSVVNAKINVVLGVIVAPNVNLENNIVQEVIDMFPELTNFSSDGLMGAA